MVTDRTRLHPAGEDALVAQVAAAAAAGVHLIQVREHDLDARALFELVKRCVAAVRATRTRILVNDRADIALAAGAAGVHLRGDSVPASRIRRVAPRGFLVGRSIHGVDEAAAVAAAGGVDYLLFGTVFDTVSKPGRPPAGVEALAAVAARVPIPVLAIGGITAARTGRLAAAGAAGYAAIGLFADAPRQQIAWLMQQAGAAFDTAGSVP
jgi:thiamine-phosphate pyrophosphorylase